MASHARCATASLYAAAARRTTNRIAMARIRSPDSVRAKNGKDAPAWAGGWADHHCDVRRCHLSTIVSWRRHRLSLPSTPGMSQAMPAKDLLDQGLAERPRQWARAQ